jgi:hypothetical protein
LSASTTGTTPPISAAIRKSRTEPRWPSVDRRAIRSVAMTPATLVSKPEELDRNAANAPAATSAPRSWPAGPSPSAALGSTSTTASVRPVISRCGAYTRPSTPYRVGSR